ncbi:MAG TPA: hypothetical protein VF790_11730 [Dissulfurispiraceae bacterium]
MTKFHSNLNSPCIKGMRFKNHIYETNNSEEIKYLREHGQQEGIIIREVNSEPYNVEEILLQISECAAETDLDALIAKIKDMVPEEQMNSADKESIIKAIEVKRKALEIKESVGYKEMIERVNSCTSIEEVDELVKEETRKTVLSAAEKKKTELAVTSEKAEE